MCLVLRSERYREEKMCHLQLEQRKTPNNKQEDSILLSSEERKMNWGSSITPHKQQLDKLMKTKQKEQWLGFPSPYSLTSWDSGASISAVVLIPRQHIGPIPPPYLIPQNFLLASHLSNNPGGLLNHLPSSS